MKRDGMAETRPSPVVRTIKMSTMRIDASATRCVSRVAPSVAPYNSASLPKASVPVISDFIRCLITRGLHTQVPPLLQGRYQYSPRSLMNPVNVCQHFSNRLLPLEPNLGP